MQSNRKPSTETLFEIKAPLASFDTVDLDDDVLSNFSRSSLKLATSDQRLTESEKSPTGSKSTLHVPESNPIKSDPIKNSSEKIKQTSPKGSKLKDTKLLTNEKKKNEVSRTSIETVTIETVAQQPVKDTFEVPSSAKDKPHDPLEPVILQTVKNKDVVAKLQSPILKNKPNSSIILSSESEFSEAFTSTDVSNGSKDTNSSENNASASDIQNRLKVKGRKHKSKATNVKYEQMDSCMSDISDHEKGDTHFDSPIPTLRLKAHKLCDSDSDSSDSDSGYIRRGFISATKGTAAKTLKSNPTALFNLPADFTDSRDSTPCSSPKVNRPTIPPPLSKEDSAIKSKRKAYEKRLQRLQVTNNPIERPRSTTPINIYSLEEYVNISSPEKSPCCSNLEKLKITLPLDDTGCKFRSPRKSARRSSHCGTGDIEEGSPVFNFNEERLFTHTKAAILLQEDGLSKGQSPKRILVPPTLSPKLSPACTPRLQPLYAQAQDPKHSPRYFYSPHNHGSHAENDDHSIDNSKTDTPKATAADIPQNWAHFDDPEISHINSNSKDDVSLDKADGSNYEAKASLGKTDTCNSENKGVNNTGSSTSSWPEDPFNSSGIFCEGIDNDDILTVRIEESGDTKICDIKYQVDDHTECSEKGDEVGAKTKNGNILNRELVCIDSKQIVEERQQE